MAILLTHELAVDLLPHACLCGLPGPDRRHALRLERTVFFGEPIDDLLVDQIMVVMLFADSEQHKDRVLVHELLRGSVLASLILYNSMGDFAAADFVAAPKARPRQR